MRADHTLHRAIAAHDALLKARNLLRHQGPAADRAAEHLDFAVAVTRAMVDDQHHVAVERPALLAAVHALRQHGDPDLAERLMAQAVDQELIEFLDKVTR